MEQKNIMIKAENKEERELFFKFSIACRRGRFTQKQYLLKPIKKAVEDDEIARRNNG